MFREKFIPVASLMLAGLLAAGPARTQEARGPPCIARAEAIEQLRTMFGERLVGYGLTHGGVVMEIYAGSSGSWTLFASTPDGRSCLIAAGEGWEPVPEPDLFAGR